MMNNTGVTGDESLSLVLLFSSSYTPLQLDLFPIHTTCQPDMNTERVKHKIIKSCFIHRALSITSGSQNKSSVIKSNSQTLTFPPEKKMTLEITMFA